ncbi:hypothetical protein E3N88_09643 [Mikania micrantha]|uniref:Uncharacterized protein n=1 Tax=Mikania micrantha TaxID=192012 RepID=A0A5N6PKI5_9ASTR|nr:hypothetical protein E3N88_09643 [Mikania micrantha]
MIWPRINVPGCDLNVPEASKQRFERLDDENVKGKLATSPFVAYRGETKSSLRVPRRNPEKSQIFSIIAYSCNVELLKRCLPNLFFGGTSIVVRGKVF